MTVSKSSLSPAGEALPVGGVSRAFDRVEVTFDDPNLVANAGLLVVATLVSRLGLESLIDRTVRLVGRVGGARSGRKVLTLVHTIVAGGSHIDHADMLRAGATQRVLPFRVMAPSTLGTFLRAFTFGHVRQLDAVIAESIRRAWRAGVGPDDRRLVIDVDSTICEVVGKAKQGADPAFRVRVRDRCAWRGTDDRRPGASEHLVELGDELAAAVSDQEPDGALVSHREDAGGLSGRSRLRSGAW
jgi:hypothetical protein